MYKLFGKDGPVYETLGDAFEACLTNIGLNAAQRRATSPAVFEAFVRRVEGGVPPDVAIRPEHKEQLVTHDADSTNICQRCGRTATEDMRYDAYECPNCGYLEWRWLSKDGREQPLVRLAVDGGHFPMRSREETGYFIDNPHPAAGLREPARLWVEGHHGSVLSQRRT